MEPCPKRVTLTPTTGLLYLPTRKRRQGEGAGHGLAGGPPVAGLHTPTSAIARPTVGVRTPLSRSTRRQR